MHDVVPMAELVCLYRALASPSRLRILSLLARRSLCVNGLARALGISQPAVSQHLEVLREAGLVSGERMGVMVHYRVDGRRIELAEAFTRRLLAGQPARGCCRRRAGARARHGDAMEEV